MLRDKTFFGGKEKQGLSPHVDGRPWGSVQRASGPCSVRRVRVGAKKIHINLHSRFRPVPIKKNEVGSGGCLVSSVFERLYAPNARHYLLKRFHSTFIRITIQLNVLFPKTTKYFLYLLSAAPGPGIAWQPCPFSLHQPAGDDSCYHGHFHVDSADAARKFQPGAR